MIQIYQVAGVIFDVDDTLLDNKPGQLGSGLHERSRIEAFRFIGQQQNIPELINITPEDNYVAFTPAAVHSLPGAVWNYLWRSGLVDSEVMNPDNKLLQTIVTKKNELHADIITNEAEEVPGASAFIRKLSKHGLGGHLAVASSAIRRDVDLFFAKIDVTGYFPPDHIKTLESAEHTKPHPELFNLAFDSLQLAEDQRPNVLAFEDDPRGIMSAKAAGLYTCAITTRFTKDELAALEVPPDLIANSYTEFEQLLGIK